MDKSIAQPAAPDEWALNICQALGADTYLNPIGGLSFFDRKKYENAGLNIHFLKLNDHPYQQILPEFVPTLSIIDVMMFTQPDTIREMINDSTFE